MNYHQVREYVNTQLKNYRVRDILDTLDDTELVNLYKQVSGIKTWETERRLIDWARHELDFFRYVLYKERHYEDLLIDQACIDCLKCEDIGHAERKYYVRRPQS
jgi:hypothetical protein